MFHMQSANIAIIETAVKEAAKEGADMIALPECWNGPYSVRPAIKIKTGCSETLLDIFLYHHFGIREPASFGYTQYHESFCCQAYSLQ